MEKREQIIAKAWKDPEFKKKLLARPKETLKEMGWKISDQVRVLVIEDSANSYTFVLPHAPEQLTKMSESEIERIAGGGPGGTVGKGCSIWES